MDQNATSSLILNLPSSQNCVSTPSCHTQNDAVSMFLSFCSFFQVFHSLVGQSSLLTSSNTTTTSSRNCFCSSRINLLFSYVVTIYLSIYISIYLYLIYIDIQIYMYTFIYVHIYICIRVYIYIHINNYIYNYFFIQPCVYSPQRDFTTLHTEFTR